jgi:S-(hydroxymethyl)glutathione dehydrogenase/alcohol dehydrogenase
MQIRAAVLREPGHQVEVETVELEPPRAGEVLVRIAAAGVCHSDVRLADAELGPGRWPIVLGHEGAGVVEAVGDDVGHVEPGDHVVLCFVPACRECRYCRAGKPNLCVPAGENAVAGMLMDGTSRLRLPDGTALQHGLMTACFSEHTVVAAGSAVKIPPSLPLWQAALLGCSVVTAVGAVKNVAGVEPGTSVVVIGCGGVGLQIVAAARRAGAGTIVAVDRVQEKLELALALGATAVVDGAREDPLPALLAVTEGGADAAFEVIGGPETIRLAWDAVRPGGTAIVVGLSPHGVEAAVPATEFIADKSLRGTYYGSGDAALELAELAVDAAAGEIDLASVVTHVDSLAGVEPALGRLRRGEGARTVLIVDAGLAGREV